MRTLVKYCVFCTIQIHVNGKYCTYTVALSVIVIGKWWETLAQIKPFLNEWMLFLYQTDEAIIVMYLMKEKSILFLFSAVL